MTNSISLYGSHSFLNDYSIPFYYLLYAIFYSILWIGRKIFEGRGYDVALSSKFGDVGLATFIIIASYIIQQPDFQPTEWMESRSFNWSMASISISAGMVFLVLVKPKHLVDGWHAIITVPMFLYFIGTTVPVYLYHGTWWQQVIGLFLLLFWLALVIYDAKTGRLDQRKWIKENRPQWRFKN